ncbi:uncharacterized protein ASPGLDRAFT_69288 [Aspergillus glaucus CBS 516.65]|uniref:Uncharacterized protein n=1 Tax=Aspergillus glaucus CBS 516.65 TaxID=1160497 RepID=A0A1L9V9G8_ASPGL|nr:hypothetical protein ASPGLDRAFT_69288 [Aspergillus glaucus CBS 516.65]OJJ80482.1 hypothetical protein ASPGLDRAFT_69288 [Aspergillus glaucus CBS 516.65]
MDRLFNYDLRRRMTKLVCTTLTIDYELDLGAKTQPPINIDDLLSSTYHLIALSTLRKMMTSTTARPGTLVVSSGYMRKGKDALKWKDIELFMVKHPEEPSCQTLLMRRDDNLAFCAIQDIIEYAIVDGAFANHRLSTPLHIADNVKEIPIFRKAVKDSKGNWVTSPTEAWTYEDLREYELAAAKSAGDENPGSLYKYQKGAAANINPSAPQELSDARKQEVEKDKELNNLIAHHDKLRAQLIAIHHQLQKGKRTNLYGEFIKAGNRVRAHKKKLLRSAEDAQRKEFFGAVGNVIIKQNYQGKPIQFDPNYYYYYYYYYSYTHLSAL